MKKIITTMLFFMTITALVSCSAQRAAVSDHSTESKYIDSLLASKEFRFIAQRINSTITDRNPLLGNISDERYYITVMKDSVSGYLPFFGRAYTATLDSKGIEFETKDFSYSIKKGKKDNETIKLTVRDVKSADSYQISITVMSNGNAYASVSSNRRETISYFGKIIAIQKK